MGGREKFVGVAAGVSGAASVAGSWQVCHNLCLLAIALLGVLGTTAVGMPLMFLREIALPFWIAAVLLLAITAALYFKKYCISPKLIVFNAGLIIAGTPFQGLQALSPLFWVSGGAIAAFSILWFAKGRLKK